MTYPTESLYDEVAYVAYHFGWSRDQILDLEHPERREYVGRIARLNSWDVATTPVGTLERAVTTLSWRGAPFAFVCVFLAVTLTYAVVHTLTTSFLRAFVSRSGDERTQKRLFGG